MISDFDPVRSPRAEINTLAELDGATVAIEAKFFLRKYFDREGESYEPLLPALGGLPFGLEAFLDKELAALRECGIHPIFIFDGLDSGKKHGPFEMTRKSSERNKAAWDLYAQSQRQESRIQQEELVEAFRRSGRSSWCPRSRLAMADLPQTGSSPK